MKKLALLAAAAATFAVAPAQADFTGVTAPANWTTTITAPGGLGSTPGSAVFTSSQLTLTGGNTLSDLGCAGGTYGAPGPCEVLTLINRAGTYTFNWSYTTSDSAGAAGDIFGVLVDNMRVDLSDPGAGSLLQSGSRSFTATSSFGFFLNCTDCTEGNASATIAGLAFVPEPATPLLLLSAVAAIGLLRRRERRA